MATELVTDQYPPDSMEIPPELNVKPSSVDEEKLGVWATETIKSGLKYGPFTGEVITEATDDMDPAYVWEIIDLDTRQFLFYINATDPERGNWMRYMKCARFFEEQNIVSQQEGTEIYYRVIKDIPPGSELLTWYEKAPLRKKRRKRPRPAPAKAPQSPKKRRSNSTDSRPSSKGDVEDADDKNIMHTSQRGRRRKVTKYWEMEISNFEDDDDSNGEEPGEIVSVKCEKVAAAGINSDDDEESLLSDENWSGQSPSNSNHGAADLGSPDLGDVHAGQGEYFQFEVQPHHIVKSRIGRKIFKCDICSSIYRHGFSLKRHFIRNHINYKYVSPTDLLNCCVSSGKAQAGQAGLLKKVPSSVASDSLQDKAEDIADELVIKSEADDLPPEDSVDNVCDKEPRSEDVMFSGTPECSVATECTEKEPEVADLSSVPDVDVQSIPRCASPGPTATVPSGAEECDISKQDNGEELDNIESPIRSKDGAEPSDNVSKSSADNGNKTPVSTFAGESLVVDKTQADTECSTHSSDSDTKINQSQDREEESKEPEGNAQVRDNYPVSGSKHSEDKVDTQDILTDSVKDSNNETNLPADITESTVDSKVEKEFSSDAKCPTDIVDKTLPDVTEPVGVEDKEQKEQLDDSPQPSTPCDNTSESFVKETSSPNLGEVVVDRREDQETCDNKDIDDDTSEILCQQVCDNGVGTAEMTPQDESDKEGVTDATATSNEETGDHTECTSDNMGDNICTGTVPCDDQDDKNLDRSDCLSSVDITIPKEDSEVTMETPNLDDKNTADFAEKQLPDSQTTSADGASSPTLTPEIASDKPTHKCSGSEESSATRITEDVASRTDPEPQTDGKLEAGMCESEKVDTEENVPDQEAVTRVTHAASETAESSEVEHIKDGDRVPETSSSGGADMVRYGTHNVTVDETEEESKKCCSPESPKKEPNDHLIDLDGDGQKMEISTEPSTGVEKKGGCEKHEKGLSAEQKMEVSTESDTLGEKKGRCEKGLSAEQKMEVSTESGTVGEKKGGCEKGLSAEQKMEISTESGTVGEKKGGCEKGLSAEQKMENSTESGAVGEKKGGSEKGLSAEQKMENSTESDTVVGEKKGGCEKGLSAEQEIENSTESDTVAEEKSRSCRCEEDLSAEDSQQKKQVEACKVCVKSGMEHVEQSNASTDPEGSAIEFPEEQLRDIADEDAVRSTTSGAGETALCLCAAPQEQVQKLSTHSEDKTEKLSSGADVSGDQALCDSLSKSTPTSVLKNPENDDTNHVDKTEEMLPDSTTYRMYHKREGLLDLKDKLLDASGSVSSQEISSPPVLLDLKDKLSDASDKLSPKETPSTPVLLDLKDKLSDASDKLCPKESPSTPILLDLKDKLSDASDKLPPSTPDVLDQKDKMDPSDKSSSQEPPSTPVLSSPNWKGRQMPGLFRCHICDELFNTIKQLKRHVADHPDMPGTSKNFACSQCDMKFAQKHNLMRHQAVHTGGGPSKAFSCKQCDKKFSGMAHLRRHERVHHGNKGLACQSCTSTFSQAAELKKHIRKSHPENYHECAYCSRYFTKKSQLEDHLKESHSKSLETNSSDLSIKKEALRFDTELDMMESIRIAAHKKVPGPKFACTVCRKRFHEYSNMCRHRRLAHQTPVFVMATSANKAPQPAVDPEPETNVIDKLEHCTPVKTTIYDFPDVDSKGHFFSTVVTKISENIKHYIEGKQEQIKKSNSLVRWKNSDDWLSNSRLTAATAYARNESLRENRRGQKFNWQAYNFPSGFRFRESYHHKAEYKGANQNMGKKIIIPVDKKADSSMGNTAMSTDEEAINYRTKPSTAGLIKAEHGSPGECSALQTLLQRDLTQVPDLASSDAILGSHGSLHPAHGLQPVVKDKELSGSPGAQSGSTTSRVECKFCSSAFIGASLLQEHMRVKHQITDLGVPPPGSNPDENSPKRSGTSMGSANSLCDSGAGDLDMPLDLSVKVEPISSPPCDPKCDPGKNPNDMDNPEAELETVDLTQPLDLSKTTKLDKKQLDRLFSSVQQAPVHPSNPSENNLPTDNVARHQFPDASNPNQHDQGHSDGVAETKAENGTSACADDEAESKKPKKPTKYICLACYREFLRYEEMAQHQEVDHPNVECRHTELSVHFDTALWGMDPNPVGMLNVSSNLVSSISANTAKESESLTCTKCNTTYNSQEELHNHIMDCADKYLPKKVWVYYYPESKKYYLNLLHPGAKAPHLNNVRRKRRVASPMKTAPAAVATSTNPQQQVVSQKPAVATESLSTLATPVQSDDGSSALKVATQLSAEIESLAKKRRRRNFELLYNPLNHVRRREMAEIIDTPRCTGCGEQFGTISLLERHIPMCSFKERISGEGKEESGSGENSRNASDDEDQEEFDPNKHTCIYCLRQFIYFGMLRKHVFDICTVRKDLVEKEEYIDEEWEQDIRARYRSISGQNVTHSRHSSISSGNGGEPSEGNPTNQEPPSSENATKRGRKKRRKGFGWAQKGRGNTYKKKEPQPEWVWETQFILEDTFIAHTQDSDAEEETSNEIKPLVLTDGSSRDASNEASSREPSQDGSNRGHGAQDDSSGLAEYKDPSLEEEMRFFGEAVDDAEQSPKETEDPQASDYVTVEGNTKKKQVTSALKKKRPKSEKEVTEAHTKVKKKVKMDDEAKAGGHQDSAADESAKAANGASAKVKAKLVKKILQNKSSQKRQTVGDHDDTDHAVPVLSSDKNINKVTGKSKAKVAPKPKLASKPKVGSKQKQTKTLGKKTNLVKNHTVKKEVQLSLKSLKGVKVKKKRLNNALTEPKVKKINLKGNVSGVVPLTMKNAKEKADSDEEENMKLSDLKTCFTKMAREVPSPAKNSPNKKKKVNSKISSVGSNTKKLSAKPKDNAVVHGLKPEKKIRQNKKKQPPNAISNGGHTEGNDTKRSEKQKTVKASKPKKASAGEQPAVKNNNHSIKVGRGKGGTIQIDTDQIARLIAAPLPRENTSSKTVRKLFHTRSKSAPEANLKDAFSAAVPDTPTKKRRNVKRKSDAVHEHDRLDVSGNEQVFKKSKIERNSPAKKTNISGGRAKEGKAPSGTKTKKGSSKLVIQDMTSD